MAMNSEVPTTSSALEELKDGDYDIVQLSKKALRIRGMINHPGPKLVSVSSCTVVYGDADVHQVTTRPKQTTQA
jgi:hypothetical protein